MSDARLVSFSISVACRTSIGPISCRNLDKTDERSLFCGHKHSESRRIAFDVGKGKFEVLPRRIRPELEEEVEPLFNVTVLKIANSQGCYLIAFLLV